MAEGTASGAEVSGGTGVLERRVDADEAAGPPTGPGAPGPAPDAAADTPPVVEEPEARTFPTLTVVGAVLVAGIALSIWLLGRTLGLVVAAAVLLAVVALYRSVVQPWHVRWGATDDEVRMPMLGDELLEEPSTVTTRAITVDAPVDQVWAWLVELGIGPGGWSARGLIDDGRLGGNRIAPRIGHLCAARRSAPGEGYEVVRIESPRCIVSRGRDASSWCLQLDDVGAGRTRLVSRFRSAFDLVPGSPILLADPAAFVTERRLLRSLRARAESGAPMPRSGSPCAP